ncbi:MAG: hypothetical protein QOH35_2592, partial [Acidobacteriaceae bacterium]|nr:hypothetical protein [Acidobacteriaceae bacterium]
AGCQPLVIRGRLPVRCSYVATWRRKPPEDNSPEGDPMWDIGLLLITALFFAVAVAYTYGCDKLRRKEDVR